MRYSLLLIDDSPEICQLMGMYLQRQGYDILVAHDGHEGLRKLSKNRPDLVLLDIMMPDIDGWQVCQQIRQISDVPIIMVTAKTHEQDIVRGLGLGADDYVTKPFDLSELCARIKAVLRRSQLPGASSPPPVLQDDWLYVDIRKRVVKAGGQLVDLTPTEFRLLKELVRELDRVVPHQRLLEVVWGPEYTDQLHYLKLYIRYLRQKLEKDPRRPRYLLTEWGVGYRLRDFRPAP